MLQCQQLVLHLQWQRLILVFGRELYSSDNGAAFDATIGMINCAGWILTLRGPKFYRLSSTKSTMEQLPLIHQEGNCQ